LDVTDIMIDDSLFDEVIQKFVSNVSFLRDEIGSIKGIKQIRVFERPFSSQGVYSIEGDKKVLKIYVKFFKNIYQQPLDEFRRGVQSEYEAIQFWYNKLKNFNGIATFRPLYYDVSLNCIITEALEGIELSKLVARNAKRFASQQAKKELNYWLKGSGKLLVTFQKISNLNTTFQLPELIEDIDIRMRELSENPVSHFFPEDRDAVLKFCFKKLHEAESLSGDTKEVYLHRDFGLNNLLLAGEKLVVFDFNKKKKGHPFHDFTRLFFQLILLSYKPIVYDKRFLRKLAQSYFEGYGYQENEQNILFRFFLLRHFFTHYIGLIRRPEKQFPSRFYNKWVLWAHKKNILKIIGDEPFQLL